MLVSKASWPFVLLAGWAVFPFFCVGQSTNSGAIEGTVIGPDGVPVANARITASITDAPTLVVSNDSDGEFSIRNLSSGLYSVRVTAPKFAPHEEAVAVAVGRTAHVAIRLSIAGIEQSVSVSAETVAMDTSQTSSVVNIDRDRVEELPIPSRNYLSFVLLSPQVAAANPALFQAGAPENGINFSFGGLRPGSNAVYLDEVNDNDEYTGSSRTQLSPEAISDFQIVNHGFAAQSGGGAGGSIDVQTRSGVNRVHGDAFIFGQDGILNAAPPLGLNPDKPDESRMRLGVALGGPIQRNRMFYYIAAEQEMARGEDTNDLSPSTLGTVNSSLRNYPPLASVNLQSGFIPTTEQETELSGRLDRVLTKSEAVMLRYAFTNSRNVNDAFHTNELTDRTARGSSFISDNSLNGTITSTLSENLLNKLSFELAQRRAAGETGQTVGPGVLISGTALFGTPYFGNERRFETHTEFADTGALQLHQHFLQFGGRADHVALRTHVPDGAQGFFVFGNLDALQNSTPDFYIQSFGNFDINLSETRFAGFAQDHWTPTSALTLDLGLRYDYNRLPSSLPQDTLNFSPRFGLAWTPFKTTILRGGFGVFYDRFQLATVNRISEFDGARAFTQIVEDAAAATLYRSGHIPVAPLNGVQPSVWRGQPGLRNPYSEVGSLSAEEMLPWKTTLTGEYQHVHGVRLGRSSNINLTPPVILTLANASAVGVSSPTPQQLGRPVFTKARIKPDYDAVNQYAASGNSTYNGATVTLNRQFQDDLQVMAGYTYSKTIDDASYDLEQPQNPYSIGDERALSLQDQRHRFTLSGLWLIGPDLDDPADAAKNANPGPVMKALTGLEFAPIVSIASGFRANPITGLDSNLEHILTFATRPVGYSRNGLSTPANVNVDLRVLKVIPRKRGHLDLVAESFNLLNHRNVSLLNSAFGSGTNPAKEFATPIAASTARRIQFSLDYEF
jgi:outer membrane receptor protein involved in Fe transport